MAGATRKGEDASLSLMRGEMPLAQCEEPPHCDKACGSLWQVVVPACCQGGDGDWVMRQLRLSEISRGLFSKLLLTAGSAMRSGQSAYWWRSWSYCVLTVLTGVSNSHVLSVHLHRI